MRFDSRYRFWVVTEPAEKSELGDILFEASLQDLEMQFRGGLTWTHNPTLFTEHAEAEREAQNRLAWRRNQVARRES